MYDYYNRVETSRYFYEPPKLSACDICEKSDCDQSCGKGDYEESNEISNEYLKDAPNRSAVPLIRIDLIIVFIVTTLFIIKKENFI